MNSIVQTDTSKCFLCGRNGWGDPLEKHHIFGAANRKKSEQDGLFVYLCGFQCHREGHFAVHRNKATMDELHSVGQRAWENKYGTREEFMQRYHKNYLEAI